MVRENSEVREIQRGQECPPSVALIGVTGYGKVHLDILLRNHEAGLWNFAAATIINPDEAGEAMAQLEALGTRIYRDYRTMLDTEKALELVCIPTAIHWHTPMTLDALASGANVFVEKPLAGSVGEVEEILAAREKSGRFVAVGFQDLYLRQAWQMKDWILAGKIGRVKRLKGIASWPRPLSYYERNAWAGKFHVNGRPVFDSPLNNALSHYVNLLIFLGGPDRESSAKVDILKANLYRAQPIETFDTASLVGRTADGADFFFHATHSSDEAINPILRVEGESGTIEWSLDAGVRLETPDGEVEQVAEAGFQQNSKRMLGDALVDMLAGGTPDYCSVEIALEHVKFIAELHSRFEPVAIPEDGRELTPANQWVIPGLLPKLREAFDTNTLLDLS